MRWRSLLVFLSHLKEVSRQSPARCPRLLALAPDGKSAGEDPAYRKASPCILVTNILSRLPRLLETRLSIPVLGKAFKRPEDLPRIRFFVFFLELKEL